MNLKNLLLTASIALVALASNAATVVLQGPITSDTTLRSSNIYVMFDEVIVKNSATLTIEAGTLIKGGSTANTSGKLIIAAGAKIQAQGTAARPIVFTSNKPAGQRRRGDWGGVGILGNAPTNRRDANGNPIKARLECGSTVDFDYGGSVANENSGVLSYVRIEYAGFVCGSNTEFNSLALAGVGSGTTIDHVQVSFGQDDGIEWWGGTVNASHLITYAMRDDDFDTDFGYSGKVQFGLIVRVDTTADQGDISNGFESDNDNDGNYVQPYTSTTFSNITIVGPAKTLASPIDPKYGWAFRIRRNSAISVFNSIVLGYKRGLRLEGAGTQAKATGDTLEFKYNIIEGSVERAFESSFDSAYLYNSSTYNTVYGGEPNATLKLVNPFAASPDFRLQSTSPALTGADFTNTKLAGFFTSVAYKGAFDGTTDWTAGWANFSPQFTDYTFPLGIEQATAWSSLSILPNPTTTKAMLSFSIEETSTLNIAVYDMFGKFISEIENKEFAKGNHEVSISTENLSNGVYFVNVSNGERNTALKMVVSK